MAAPLKLTTCKRVRTKPSHAAFEAPAVSSVQAETTMTDGARPDPKGKLGALIGLLRRPDGATLAELMAATGWQAHSVRGAIAGAVKKKHGLTVTSEKTETGRTYRIVSPSIEVVEA